MIRHASYLWLLGVLIAGCGSSVERIDPERSLPFSVKLTEIHLPDPNGVDSTPVETPVAVVDSQELTAEVTRLLEESGIFTRMVAEGDDRTDLELEIAVRGYDFGPSRPLLSGSVFSTLAWLFSGIPSWYIDDREYPESGVSLSMIVRHADDGRGGPASGAERAGGVLFKDDLFPRDLKLSFAERSDTSDWLWNVLLPPWVFGEGDADKAGRNLVLRSGRFFVGSEVPRLLASFPANYILKSGCFLGHDRERREFVIVSRAPVLKVVTGVDNNVPRVLNQDDLHDVEGAEKDELERWLRERVAGLGTDATDRYYRIPLTERERGFVGIEVAVEGRTTPARWTIRAD